MVDVVPRSTRVECADCEAKRKKKENPDTDNEDDK